MSRRPGEERDLLADAAVALAASTNVEGEIAAVYAATARMLVVQARERLDQIEHGVTAREAELARVAREPQP